MPIQTVADIDKEIKRLKNKRKAVIKKTSSDLGEVLLSVMPDIPRTKRACREYLTDVYEIVRRHGEEFAAIRRERNMKQSKGEPALKTNIQNERIGDYNEQRADD